MNKLLTAKGLTAIFKDAISIPKTISRAAYRDTIDAGYSEEHSSATAMMVQIPGLLSASLAIVTFGPAAAIPAYYISEHLLSAWAVSDGTSRADRIWTNSSKCLENKIPEPKNV